MSVSLCIFHPCVSSQLVFQSLFWLFFLPRVSSCPCLLPLYSLSWIPCFHPPPLDGCFDAVRRGSTSDRQLHSVSTGLNSACEIFATSHYLLPPAHQKLQSELQSATHHKYEPQSSDARWSVTRRSTANIKQTTNKWNISTVKATVWWLILAVKHDYNCKSFIFNIKIPPYTSSVCSSLRKWLLKEQQKRLSFSFSFSSLPPYST